MVRSIRIVDTADYEQRCGGEQEETLHQFANL